MDQSDARYLSLTLILMLAACLLVWLLSELFAVMYAATVEHHALTGELFADWHRERHATSDTRATDDK